MWELSTLLCFYLSVGYCSKPQDTTEHVVYFYQLFLPKSYEKTVMKWGFYDFSLQSYLTDNYNSIYINSFFIGIMNIAMFT